MPYNFDRVIDRGNTDSVKWNTAPHELPMWVADMDFPAAPAIQEALNKRMDHGIFGYTLVPDGWYDAYIGWWKSRHGFEIHRDWLSFTTGVVPVMSSVIRSLTEPGDQVLIQSPVYNMFFGSVVNSGRRVIENPLRRRDDGYEMDFADLERKLADPKTSLMLLCNPHNPIGKIWDAETLGEVGRLAKKHGVIVISDEIHCDITAPGKGYLPFASVSDACRDISITCIAPTKTFNLAGIKTAAVFVPNEALRAKVFRCLELDELTEPTVFSCVAAIAAFTRCGGWLDELREYLWENRRVAEEYIRRELPRLRFTRADATYLMWIDAGAYGKSQDVAPRLREKTGLFVNAGAAYGKSGENFLRLNLACPRTVLLDGLQRLKAGFLSME